MPRWKILIAFLVLPSIASAQDIPTDQELFAGYCAGVMIERTATKVLGVPCSASLEICSQLEKAARETDAANQHRLARFRAYIAAKGYSSGDRHEPSHTAILNSIKAGRADYVTCSAHDILARFAACDGVCTPNTQTQSCKACLSDQMPAVCKSTLRCNDPSLLSF